MPIAEALAAQLDKLARFQAGPFPVVSLYLNMQPDQHGRDHFEPYLRKELADRLRTYRPDGPERERLEADAEKIRAYVSGVEASANGLALFACSAADLFEPIVLAAPIDEHRLYISDEPHLYPLARLLDAHPRYAVVLADSARSRILVVAANQVERGSEFQGTKTKRHKMGGWSQARYQRHVDNYRAQNAKEVADMLTTLARQEKLSAIVLSANDVVQPLLREHLSRDILDLVVDTANMDPHAPEAEVLDRAADVLREKDAESDRERVDALFQAYRSNGLATVGVDTTMRALTMGQVDELLIAAAPDTIVVNDPKAREQEADSSHLSSGEQAAGELVAKARQTSANVRFIEDRSLLAPVGGVGAFLRFKL
jgi:peptide chain release factor subunit 1